MLYYIIEHPTRGTLLDRSEVDEPHFSWSNTRSDKRNMQSFSVAEAIKQRDRYVTADIRPFCQIRRSSDWEVVA